MLDYIPGCDIVTNFRFDSDGKVILEMVNDVRDKVRELPGFFQINKKPSTLLLSSTHSSNNPTPMVPPEAQPNLGELQESAGKWCQM